MSWTRSKLKAIGKKNGFTGNTGEEFAAWAAEKGFEFEGLHTTEEVAAAFNKTVTITWDEADDVLVNPPEQVAEGDLEDDEVKMEDGEDEEQMKQFRKWQKSQQVQRQKSGGNPAARSDLNMPGSTRIGDRRGAKMLKYDRAIKSNQKLSKTGHIPVFGDAERMEAFNAAVRLSVCGDRHHYSQKSFDERIVGKTHIVGQNGLGGALVFGEYFPELIENFSEYGAARAAAGVEPMQEGVKTVSKLHTDITVGDIGEAEAMTATTALFGNVTLTAKKSYALAKFSMEILNDSAFDIEDKIGSSMMRSLRGYEDDCYFNSANNRQGLSSKIGGNSTLDADLSARTTANWGGYTEADIQNVLGLLPAWASEDPNFGIACSWQFYMTVLRRFALSAGGNTGSMVLSGVSGPGLTSRWEWDGIPIYINNKAPKTYSDGQIDAYVGAFSHATKLGVVTGSEQLATTDQRYFDEDVFAVKMTQRWGINCHDVNNEALATSADTGSGIIALKA